MGRRVRRRRVGVVLAATVLLALGAPGLATAAAPGSNLSADLDGRPIPLVDVGQHYCQDFDAPLIHCYSTSAALEAAVAPMTASASVNYVVVFDYTGFQGSYMYMSDDYTVLALIGWNDRISSFIAENSMSGKFWTDWFYGGTGYYFCCNQWVSSLGSFDNTFSSVFHY